jgi:predicted NAD/FAD-binding protein
MRIAIVGTGIAGMGAAWALNQRHDITVFEADSRPGGHANTVDIEVEGWQISVDTGFIVYNNSNYPHLKQLFRALGVKTEQSNMSFAVSLQDGRKEYAGSFPGLFAQPANALRLSHWEMIRDLLRFYREAPSLLGNDTFDGNLGDYLRRHGYGRAFVADHLLPMAAAIWSCPAGRMLDFPAKSFVQFLHNHGLMLVKGRPRWRTVTGGSRAYVRRLTESFRHRLRLSTPVVSARRDAAGVWITTAQGKMERFDHVVLATHGDQALQILGADADMAEREILGAFAYSRNRAILHRDPALMPRRRAVWSSWNYLSNPHGGMECDVSVTYWMNRLQNIKGPDIFLSLNPLRDPDPSLVHAEFTYDHPMFDSRAVAAQARLPEVQGARRTWFCGSYCGYGFHEDALEAGLAVAEALDAPVPWRDTVVPASPAALTAAPLPEATSMAAE